MSIVSSTSICGYGVIEVLSAGESFLVQMGSRKLVLKRLDVDCLISGESKLHPTIRDRLQRVQQLADVQVANFLGVEREAEQREDAFLLWEYVPGQTLKEWSNRSDITADRFLTMARELILCVSRLHEWGVVHGHVHARNVIVDTMGKIKLTHVSPLLYGDPHADVIALAELFYDLAQNRPHAGVLDEIAAQLLQPSVNLRTVGARAMVAADDEISDEGVIEEENKRGPLRFRSAGIIAAGVLVMLLMAALLGIWVRHIQVPVPVPPDAPSAALQP